MGRPKKVKLPPVPAPAPIPDVSEEAPEEAMKKARRRRGFERTIITGSLAPSPTGKKTTLGG